MSPLYRRLVRGHFGCTFVMVSFSNPEFVYIQIMTIIVLFKPIFLYRLRWIHYEASWSSCLLFVFGSVQVKDGLKWTRRGFVKTWLERDLNIDSLQRENDAAICSSWKGPTSSQNDRAARVLMKMMKRMMMMMMMSRDGGWRRAALLHPHPDWQTQVLGEGIERRKENSARKKLKTKRKESKEKFGERVKHVER